MNMYHIITIMSANYWVVQVNFFLIDKSRVWLEKDWEGKYTVTCQQTHNSANMDSWEEQNHHIFGKSRQLVKSGGSQFFTASLRKMDSFSLQKDIIPIQT